MLIMNLFGDFSDMSVDLLAEDKLLTEVSNYKCYGQMILHVLFTLVYFYAWAAAFYASTRNLYD